MRASDKRIFTTRDMIRPPCLDADHTAVSTTDYDNMHLENIESISDNMLQWNFKMTFHFKRKCNQICKVINWPPKSIASLPAITSQLHGNWFVESTQYNTKGWDQAKGWGWGWRVVGEEEWETGATWSLGEEAAETAPISQHYCHPPARDWVSINTANVIACHFLGPVSI